MDCNTNNLENESVDLQLQIRSLVNFAKAVATCNDVIVNHIKSLPLSSHAFLAALIRAWAWDLLNLNEPSSSNISSRESRLIRSRSLGSSPNAAGPRSRHWSPIQSATSLSGNKVIQYRRTDAMKKAARAYAATLTYSLNCIFTSWVIFR